MSKSRKKKPETTAALDRIAAAPEGLSAEANRLGLASIVGHMRELHRRHSERK